MKIKFLKTHFQYSVGEVHEVEDARAEYFIRMSVAEKADDPVKEKIEKKKEKAEHKTAK